MEQFDSLVSNVRENLRRSSENEQIRILLERQREQILADCQAEIQKHEFEADYDRRSIQKLEGVIESQRGEIYRAHQGDEQLRRDQLFLHDQLLEQNRDLREAHMKSLNEMEELKRFNSQPRFRNYRLKLIVWMIREIFKMLNQYAVDNPTLPVDQCHSHLIQFLKGCWDILSQRRAAEKGRQVFRTHMVFREGVFANPTASSSALYPQELNPWISKKSEHTSPHVMSECQTPVQDQRCQSGPSDRNSFIPREVGFSKNYEADQQRLQISDPHVDKFTTPATFACWKTRFKTEVCTCSQFSTETMLWIKEVELVHSVDDLRSSRYSMRRSLQHWTESSIIPASKERSVWRNRKPKKRTARKTDRFPDLRVLPGRWSQWFCRELCRPKYSCSSECWYSGIRFEMGRNSIVDDTNPIWWHLGKLVQIKNTRV